ncbi:hypothetical protein R1sor_004841 [Riccia sorocarpa]|uniref:Uncharacterized protein n=1 Tax=Riccia sorocarpa TaxID=122646 RepID=A0ABD3HM81_9MARC
MRDKGKRPVEELQQEVPQPTRPCQEALRVHRGETSCPAAVHRVTKEVPRVPDLPPREARVSSPDVVVIPPAPASPPQVIDLSPLDSHVASRRVLERIRERRAHEQVLEQVEDRIYYLADDGVAYTRLELLRHDRVSPRRCMRGRVRHGGVWGGVVRY